MTVVVCIESSCHQAARVVAKKIGQRLENLGRSAPKMPPNCHSENLAVKMRDDSEGKCSRRREGDGDTAPEEQPASRRFSRALSSRRTPRLKRFGVLHVAHCLVGTTSLTATVPMSAYVAVSVDSGTIRPATATVWPDIFASWFLSPVRR
jgi:hypothetical protein